MEEYIGIIKMFAGNFAPRGYAFCDGKLLPISQNTALFSILGTTYGGNGQTTFALPDLRGRVMIGTGQGSGLTNRNLGDLSGSETVTLNVNNIPAHIHALNGINGNADSPFIANRFLTNGASNLYGNKGVGENLSALNSESVGQTGGSQAHDNMPPFLAMNFIICTEGVFPPRN